MNNIDSLRLIQSLGATDIISTLRTVEINCIDICNRSCSFCPQSDNYKSKKGFFSLDIIKKIAVDLRDIQYNGRVSFTGFGEPLLYKHIVEAIEIIKKTVSNISCIEIVTNGDYLTQEKVNNLNIAGCTNITVSMYDADITDKIVPMFVNSKIDITLKHYYNGFKTVNRNDIIKDINLDLNRPCYLPFYKMMIDIDGNVLVCANDWGRKGIVGNVTEQSVKDIWLGDNLNSYRSHLVDGNRSKCSPCKSCNINGTLYGKENIKYHV